MAQNPDKNNDWLTNAARGKASEFDGEQLQKEILSQLYIQNHFLTKQVELLNKANSYLMFFSITIVSSIVLAVLFALKLS